jgi:hypothetical protein
MKIPKAKRVPIPDRNERIWELSKFIIIAKNVQEIKFELETFELGINHSDQKAIYNP